MKLLAVPLVGLMLFGGIAAPTESHDIWPASGGLVPLHTLDMVTALSGWGTTGTQVVRTVDGGKTWSPLYRVPKPTPSPTNGGYFVFASRGLRRAWAVVTSARGIWTYRTSDGGAKWRSLAGTFAGSRFSAVPGQLLFSDGSHGWMLLHDGVAMGSAPHQIVRTTNGGKTWKRVEYQYISRSSPHSLPVCDGAVGNLTFRGASDGWSTGLCGPGPQFKEVYRTTDGGKRWSHVTPSTGSRNLTYFDPGQVFEFGKTLLMPVSLAEQPEFVLYRSTDLGVTWRPTIPIYARTPGYYGGPIAQFAPFNADISWVSIGHKLWRTTDGGFIWHVIHRGRAFGAMSALSWSRLVSFDGRHVYQSDDGGRTWSGFTPKWK